jgi:hypothetical protein
MDDLYDINVRFNGGICKIRIYYNNIDHMWDDPPYYRPKFNILKFVSKKVFMNNLNIRFLGTEKNQFLNRFKMIILWVMTLIKCSIRNAILVKY